MTVKLTLSDKCHEPDDKGTVTVYDQSGQLLKTDVFSKDYSPVTISENVPPHGRIDYVCQPSSVDGEQKCESTVVSVTKGAPVK